MFQGVKPGSPPDLLDGVLTDLSIPELAEGLRSGSFPSKILGKERIQLLAALLDRLTAENATLILDEVRKADALGIEDVHVLVEAWAGHDPKAAIAFLEEHIESFRHHHGMAYLGATLGAATSDLEMATALSLSCLAVEEKDGQIHPVKTKDGSKNFRILTELLLETLDRESYFQWAESLHHDQISEEQVAYAKGTAIGLRLGRMVSNGEELAASQYLALRPSFSGRDEAVWRFSMNLAESDPESSMAWLITIDDTERRNDLLLSFGKKWWQNDPSAASRWLEESPLDDQLIRSIEGSRHINP